MKTIISSTLTLLVFIFVSSSASAQNLISHSDITNQRSCFSSQFSSYESWLAFIKEVNGRKAKTEAELKIRVQKFQEMFSEEDFKRNQATIDCIIFKYKVDDILVDGFFIQPKGKKSTHISL